MATPVTQTLEAFAYRWSWMPPSDPPTITTTPPEKNTQFDLIYIGKASVTITLAPAEEAVAAQMASLNAQLAKVKIDARTAENAILDRISKLQCLEYTPGEPLPPEVPVAPAPLSDDEIPF